MIEIYQQTMGVITKGIFKSIILCIVVRLKSVLEKVIVEDVLMMFMDKKV